jgi:hypothetical protein
MAGGVGSPLSDTAGSFLYGMKCCITKGGKYMAQIIPLDEIRRLIRSEASEITVSLKVEGVMEKTSKDSPGTFPEIRQYTYEKLTFHPPFNFDVIALFSEMMMRCIASDIKSGGVIDMFRHEGRAFPAELVQSAYLEVRGG